MINIKMFFFNLYKMHCLNFNFNFDVQESCKLFECLHLSWSHNPVATLSLCLLSQNYSHACDIVKALWVFLSLSQHLSQYVSYYSRIFKRFYWAFKMEREIVSPRYAPTFDKAEKTRQFLLFDLVTTTNCNEANGWRTRVVSWTRGSWSSSPSAVRPRSLPTTS